MEKLRQISYGKNKDGKHVMIGEYSLCGLAWDEFDIEDCEKPKFVTCPDCASIISQLSKVDTMVVAKMNPA